MEYIILYACSGLYLFQGLDMILLVRLLPCMVYVLSTFCRRLIRRDVQKCDGVVLDLWTRRSHIEMFRLLFDSPAVHCGPFLVVAVSLCRRGPPPFLVVISLSLAHLLAVFVIITIRFFPDFLRRRRGVQIWTLSLREMTTYSFHRCLIRFVLSSDNGGQRL
jgi:hypothetical protein